MRYILFFAVVLSSLYLHAFKLSPMVAQFATEGDGKTTSFFIENTSEERVAVQIDIFYRTQDEAGKEVRTETKDFTVYPSQIVLKPKQKRTIRVTWQGVQKVTKELAYRLVAEELPIDLQKKKKEQRTNINFLLKYVASLYVVPDGAKPKVVVKAAKKKKVKGQEMMELTLENKGKAHKVLNEIIIKAKSGKKEVLVDQKSLEVFATENLLAETERTFLFPWPKGVAEKPTLEIDFRDPLNKEQK